MQSFSIAIIILYFGHWPAWFQIYLETCKRNPILKFFIFTDCPIPEKDFENIIFIPFSLQKFNQLAAQKLHLSINLRTAYKLCDFKPAYGVIFENYLTGFDFWGYSDVDLIFGNVMRFLTPDLLSDYDIITARREYVVGHFTIYRNCKKVNVLFQKIKNYELAFTNESYMDIDECGFLWQPLLAGIPIDIIPVKIDNMTQVIRRSMKACGVKAHFQTLVIEQDNLNRNGQFGEFKYVLLWDNGHLINLNDQKEYLYFHFHLLKKLKIFKIPGWKSLPDRFYISREGLFTV